MMSRAAQTPPDLKAIAGLEAIRQTAVRSVDQPLLYGATSMLASTIEAAIPHLSSFPDAVGGTHGVVAGCDVLNLVPRLCIGGEGNNTYTADAALVIDLGGDDIHAHRAGAGSTTMPVSITIDLSGDDAYTREDGPAQGAGNLGIGILVDLEGDDSYSIATPTTAGNVASVGQGSNHSAGVGILYDGAGTDAYAITNAKYDQTTATGQGRGAQPGFGLLMDVGIDDDSYVLRARQPGPIELPNEVKVGGINVNGQGRGGLGGVGILSDDGGADSMTLEAIAATVAPTESRPVTSVPLFGPSGLATASTGGVALVRNGPGNSKRTVLGTQQGPWAGIVGASAFGWASGGAAALIDEGGDDVYDMRAASIGSRAIMIDDSCGCEGAAAVATQSIPNVAAASVSGMGYAVGGGVGMLRDLGGDDRYLADVTATVLAHVDDARTQGALGASSASAIANAVSLSVQGVGVGGQGLLLDESGEDVYSASAISSATGLVEVARVGTSAITTASSGRVFTTAQAAGDASGGIPGQGMLRDLGGSDSYDLASTSTAVTSPGGTATPGLVTSSGQASVRNNSVAVLFDEDDGDADGFALAPEDPACVGTRGAPPEWQDCGAGYGYGTLRDRTNL